MLEKDLEVLQEMYICQRLTSPDGEEYIVRGAEVFCGWGTEPCALNLPVDHGETTADDRPLITVKDHTVRNVSGFTWCKKLQRKCTPELSDWSNSSSRVKKLWDASSNNYEYAVTRSATADCRRGGGIVIFSSSGQIIPDYLGDDPGGTRMELDIKYTWEREHEDFLGFFHTKHGGIYNLGILLPDPVSKASYSGGSIFIYQKQGYLKKTLRYAGQSVIMEHTERVEEFKDEKPTFVVSDNSSLSNGRPMEFYWTLWAEFRLEKNTDYYIEIDCPGIQIFNYKLVLRQRDITLADRINEVMCGIDADMADEDKAKALAYQAREEALRLRAVVGIGLTAGISAGFTMSGAVQLVIDFHGNVGIQASYGVGEEMGTSADISAAVSVYPGVDSIYDLEGFGVEIGGSGGPLLIGSVALLLAGEGDEIDLAGFMAGVGVRTPTKPGELHVTMSNTFPTISLGNIFTSDWDFIYRQWKKIFDEWEEYYQTTL